MFQLGRSFDRIVTASEEDEDNLRVITGFNWAGLSTG